MCLRMLAFGCFYKNLNSMEMKRDEIPKENKMKIMKIHIFFCLVRTIIVCRWLAASANVCVYVWFVYGIGLGHSYEFHIMSPRLRLAFIPIVRCWNWYRHFFLWLNRPQSFFLLLLIWFPCFLNTFLAFTEEKRKKYAQTIKTFLFSVNIFSSLIIIDPWYYIRWC